MMSSTLNFLNGCQQLCSGAMICRSASAGILIDGEENSMNCSVCQSSRISPDKVWKRIYQRCNATSAMAIWIRGAEYWKWLNSRGPIFRSGTIQTQAAPGRNRASPSIAPSVRFRMVKYLVGHGSILRSITARAAAYLARPK